MSKKDEKWIFKTPVHEPYLIKRVVIIEKRYNPEYGNDRVCECGHPYYRHFDTYDHMNAVGCKYCECREFREKNNTNEQ